MEGLFAPYCDAIEKGDFYQLENMPKLTQLNIESISNVNIKIVLYTYYEFYEELKKFSSTQINDIKSKYNISVFIIACKIGNIEIIKYLNEIGINIREDLDEANEAIYLVIENGNLEIIKYLKEIGFDIFNTTYSDFIHNSFLLAASFGQIEIMIYLKENGIDVDAVKENDGNNALLAVDNCQFDTVVYLLDNGFDIEFQNKEEETAFFIAAQ